MPMAQSKVQRLSVGSGCRSKTVRFPTASSVSTAGWPSASDGLPSDRPSGQRTVRPLLFSSERTALPRRPRTPFVFTYVPQKKKERSPLRKQPPGECLPEGAFRSKPPSEKEFRILCNALQSSPSLIHETLIEAIHAKESPRGGGGGRRPDLVCGGERRGR